MLGNLPTWTIFKKGGNGRNKAKWKSKERKKRAMPPKSNPGGLWERFQTWIKSPREDDKDGKK